MHLPIEDKRKQINEKVEIIIFKEKKKKERVKTNEIQSGKYRIIYQSHHGVYGATETFLLWKHFRESMLGYWSFFFFFLN